MDYMRNTFAGRIEANALEEGIGIGVVEKIISTLLENLSVTNVAEMTKLSIEEVSRIRDSISTSS